MAAHGKTTAVADATVAIDGLEALEITLNFTTKVAFDGNLVGVDRVNDRVQLFGREILGAGIGVDVGLFKNFRGVAGAHAIDVRQGGFDAFVSGDVDSK